jgi:hypothetical protein
MRAAQFIIERMETTWVRPWIDRAVSHIGSYKNDIEWFSKFFKNLNSDQELATWKEQNIQNKLTIKPKLLDKRDVSYAILNAEHEIFDDPLEHVITVEINVSQAPSDDKTTKTFIDRLSAVLIHELNHTHQREQQLKKSKDPEAVFDIETTIWKKKPPKPVTKRDEYYIYMLDNLEKDAWISQVASEIHSSLGNDSVKHINSILRQAQREEYATIGSKIIQVPNLKILYDAINYYGRYLKVSKEAAWNKIKKELYQYLSKYGK